MNAPPPSAADLENAAARWLLAREEQDWSAEDEHALLAWLDQSHAHRAAFWRLEYGWHAADRVAAIGDATRARPVATGSDTVERSRWAGGRRTAIAASVALLALAAGALTWRQDVLPSSEEGSVVGYRTARGSQKVVALADGSRIELNTATRLRAASGRDAREVWLDGGEAFFDIAHRDDRHFVVHAGASTVTVLGTRFSVRRDGAEVTVAVLSGRVQVNEGGAVERGAGTVVDAGAVAVLRPQATLLTAPAPAKVQSMTAWRDGMLVFDDMPLDQAAAEFNRYTSERIVVADPELAQLRIGGSFRTGDSRPFVSLLRRAYGVRVRRVDGQTVLER